MNEIRFDSQGSSTFSQALTGVGLGLGAFLVVNTLQMHPNGNLSEQSNKPLLQQPYSLDRTLSTFTRYATITGEYITAPIGFEQSVGNFYARLLANQEPLGEVFEKVLYENLWDLYES